MVRKVRSIFLFFQASTTAFTSLMTETAKTRFVDLVGEITDNVRTKEIETIRRLRAEEKSASTDQVVWAARLESVNRCREFAKSKIRLNVGGTLFTVSKDTLLTCPSFFSDSFETGWKEDADGEYYIDRDPLLFHHVLAFFRTGHWRFAGMSREQRALLESEVEFYGLTPTLPQLWHVLDRSKAGTSITISNEGRTCTSGSNHETVLGADPLPRVGTITWDVTVDRFSSNPWTSIGIAEEGVPYGSHFTCTQSGCGLYIDNQNCGFRQRDNTEEDVVGTVGAAVNGKIIRIIVRRPEGGNTTIQFESNGSSTREFEVKLGPGAVYLALSPYQDCVFSVSPVGIVV